MKTNIEAHWRANVRLMLGLLVIWAGVSFGFGILLADWLDQFRLGGYKLGFWFSQQGSILTFVVLIFVYAWRMGRIDATYDSEEKEDVIVGLDDRDAS